MNNKKLTIINPFSDCTIPINSCPELKAEVDAENIFLNKTDNNTRYVIDSPFKAAEITCLGGNAGEFIDQHINSFLLESDNYNICWRENAGTKINLPSAAIYQAEYEGHYDEQSRIIDKEILQSGIKIPISQVLFHGGAINTWGSNRPIVTTTSHPLSTSFSPQIAYNNMLHKGKFLKYGRIDLFCIIATTEIPAYVFPIQFDPNSEETLDLTHEKEVLLHSKVKLFQKEHERFIRRFTSSIDISSEEYGYQAGEYSIEVYVWIFEASFHFQE